jgi:hypothetical protein
LLVDHDILPKLQPIQPVKSTECTNYFLNFRQTMKHLGDRLAYQHTGAIHSPIAETILSRPFGSHRSSSFAWK